MPDVVIVGGGIIGCTAADALSARGADVRLIDRRPLGGGATQASGGMLAPYVEGAHAPALEALGARSLAAYAARAADLGDVPYAANGSLHVAFDDDEAAVLESLAAGHRERGVESQILSGAQARALEHAVSPSCTAALLVSAHALVGARRFADRSWSAAAARGATWTAASVTGIRQVAGGRLRVETSAGDLAASHVVLASGAWTPGIAIDGIAPVPVRPVRGQLLHLRMQPSSSRGVDGGGVSRIVWGSRCYLVPWPDGTLLVGATTEDVGYDERATASGVRDLIDAGAEVVPSARQAEFLGVRVGLRPASPDELPIIGRSARVPGLVYATGHYRNGVLLAPLTAELVAKAVAGEDDSAFAVTSPARFGDL